MARPLKRALLKHLEDILSDEMLKGRFKNGGVIEVSLQEDALVFTEKSSAVNVWKNDCRRRDKVASKSV